MKHRVYVVIAMVMKISYLLILKQGLSKFNGFDFVEFYLMCTYDGDRMDFIEISPDAIDWMKQLDLEKLIL